MQIELSSTDSEGIFRLRIGDPFPTSSVCSHRVFPKLTNLSLSQDTPDEVGALLQPPSSEGSELRWELGLDVGDLIYGLGQTMGGINKRGGRYRMYAVDDHRHTPDKSSLYGAHNFLLLKTSQGVAGLFVDHPGEVVFDVGFTQRDRLVISVPDQNVDLYIIEGSDLIGVVKRFMKLVGRPWMPPRWAFGYHQSRWGYRDSKEVLQVADALEAHNIPCDAIYLDLDYMDSFKVFTTSDERFPDFQSFASSLKARDIRLVSIVDPGVKIQPGYDVYDEGKEQGYFVKHSDGSIFKAAVWPGYTHLPDFLNPAARAWWGTLYKKLYRLGIEGFWNDMNEPAVFFSSEGMAELTEVFRSHTNDPQDLGIEFLDFMKTLNSISNNRDDYRAMRQASETHGVVSQERVHNLYGFMMAKATAEGFASFASGQRLFLISRSSYIGQHRYGGLWTGDNSSWWDHLRLHIQHMVSLGVCGFFFVGADIGGFSSDCSGELLVRWTQLGVFSPFLRNHSALTTRRQEPWAFDSKTLDETRKAIYLRYALLPYIYSEYRRSREEGVPLVRMLALDFEYDARAQRVEDQFMFGQGLLIAPILHPNLTERMVYLPAGRWLRWRTLHPSVEGATVFDSGDRCIEVASDEIPVFLRENHMVCFVAPPYAEDKESSRLRVLAFVSDCAVLDVYADDGLTQDFEKGGYAILRLKVERRANDLICEAYIHEGLTTLCPYKRVDFIVYDADGQVARRSVSVLKD